MYVIASIIFTMLCVVVIMAYMVIHVLAFCCSILDCDDELDDDDETCN